MEVLKKYTLYGIAGGQMGTIARKYKSGVAYVYNVEGFKVVKEVYNKYGGDYTRFIITGRNLKEFIDQSSLNMEEVRKENEKQRLIDLRDIMKSDITRIKSLMIENKKGFVYFMNDAQKKGHSKAESFATVLRDFYSEFVNWNFRTEQSIIKIMVKYGYDYTTMEQARKLYRDNY
jgi:ribosome-binding ATPase YchF (GTP1/OBG family)